MLLDGLVAQGGRPAKRDALGIDPAAGGDPLVGTLTGLPLIGDILDVETVIGIVPTDPEGELVGALHPLPDQIEALDYAARNLNDENKK